MYLDSDNWLKASVEYENDEFQHLGSVVTNNGYSDWTTTAIPSDVNKMWYRFSRREEDYCIECSYDGKSFTQMRICHMWKGSGKIRFGIYACSPEDSSFETGAGPERLISFFSARILLPMKIRSMIMTATTMTELITHFVVLPFTQK